MSKFTVNNVHFKLDTDYLNASRHNKTTSEVLSLIIAYNLCHIEDIESWEDGDGTAYSFIGVNEDLRLMFAGCFINGENYDAHYQAIEAQSELGFEDDEQFETIEDAVNACKQIVKYINEKL